MYRYCFDIHVSVLSTSFIYFLLYLSGRNYVRMTNPRNLDNAIFVAYVSKSVSKKSVHSISYNRTFYF